MLKFRLVEAMKLAADNASQNTDKLARKVTLATSAEGRAWRKQDARLRKPYSLSGSKA